MDNEQLQRLIEPSNIVYRDDEMKAMLTPSEWEAYRAMDLEVQVCVAHLVRNGKSFDDVLRFLGMMNVK
jgi:hypothetical protein